MKTIYHMSVEDDDLGEAEAMFAEDGITILGQWSGNDATWRGEYFNGFLEELGIKVKDMPRKMEKAAKAAMKAFWNL